jgi:hypothetical protein
MRRVALALLWILAAGPLLGADPFYDELLAEGSLAAERGDLATAARKLRVACFGLLEEPPRLADCRVRLALVEAERADRPAFEQAFGKVVDIERRFGAYSAAELPESVRAAFEERVLAWIPASSLEEVPVFAAALRRAQVARLASLGPTERQHELEALAAAEPTNPEWPLALAGIATDQRNVVLAREWLARLESLAPSEPEGRCLRGRIAAMAADCISAVADLPACTAPPPTPEEAVERLACWTATGDLDTAEAFAAALPPPLRDSRQVRKASREIAQAREQRERAAARLAEEQARAAARLAAAPPAGDAAETAAAAGQAAPAADPAPEPAPAALPEQELRELRGALRRSRDYATLDRVSTELTRLADAHPDWQEAQRVAGEAAYRASRWSEAVRLLERGGLESGAPPPLLFYYAVALWESGRSAEAAVALERALPGLERTPLVETYTRRILPPPGG